MNEKLCCLRCCHIWEPRIPARPVRCPRCQSCYWDRPRGTPKGAKWRTAGKAAAEAQEEAKK